MAVGRSLYQPRDGFTSRSAPSRRWRPIAPGKRASGFAFVANSLEVGRRPAATLQCIQAHLKSKSGRTKLRFTLAMGARRASDGPAPLRHARHGPNAIRRAARLQHAACARAPANTLFHLRVATKTQREQAASPTSALLTTSPNISSGGRVGIGVCRPFASTRKWVEEQSTRVCVYQKEMEQRRWTVLEYGDVMHTYRRERHMWRTTSAIRLG